MIETTTLVVDSVEDVEEDVEVEDSVLDVLDVLEVAVTCGIFFADVDPGLAELPEISLNSVHSPGA